MEIADSAHILAGPPSSRRDYDEAEALNPMIDSQSQNSRYSVRIEDCDVTDRVMLSAYREKRDEWLRWYELDPNEPNSIQQQLFSMHFLDLTYRVLREFRQQSANSQSLLLGQLLDQGYVATQVLAIRRLVDKRKDVISLRRLLDDISDHRVLQTRENYVCYNGLPYNPESWRELPQTPEIQMWGIDAPGLGKYIGSRERHKVFDQLAGVEPSARSRADLIQQAIFEKLDLWLTSPAVAQLVTLSHKFFAHAADMDSRGTLEFSGIKLEEISEMHRALVRVERALTDELLFSGDLGRDVIPMPPLGLFKGLDQPYASGQAICEMQARWQHLSDERNKWSRGISDELYS